MRTVQPNYHILLRHFTLRTLPSNARRYTLITMHIDVKDLLIWRSGVKWTTGRI